MLARFGRGFASLGRALPFALEDRRLRRLTLAPALLALLLTALSAAALFHFAHGFISRHSSGSWAVLWWIALILAVTGATWLAWIVSCLVATAPFAEKLAERTGELCGAQQQKAGRWLDNLGHTLLSILIYAAITIPLFVLQLAVPVLSPLTAALGLLCTAQFLAYDLFDPALSRRGLSFAEKWRYLRRAEALGLGVAAALAAALPLLGVLVAPLGIVAASRLSLEK